MAEAETEEAVAIEEVKVVAAEAMTVADAAAEAGHLPVIKKAEEREEEEGLTKPTTYILKYRSHK
jgi:hypothetical protein